MTATEYPLRRDDARAQLDPRYLDWPEITAPIADASQAQHRSFPNARERTKDTANAERSVLHHIPSRTTIELDDVVQLAALKDNAGPDSIEAINESDAVTRLSEFNYGALSISNETSDAPPSVTTMSGQLHSADTTAWPMRANAKLFVTWPNNTTGTCSGTLIGYKYALTSGHCVHNADRGGWATAVVVVPGLDGTYMPFGNANATFLNSVTGWTHDRNNDSDYAMITLDRAIGFAAGHTGLCSLSDSLWTNRLFDMFSYPGNRTQRKQVWATDVIEDFDSTMLYSYVESAGGSSGAAWMPWNMGGAYTCGIHRGKDSFWGHYYSSAVRISNSRFNRIESWMNENASLDEYAPSNIRWTYLGGTTYRRPTVTTSKDGRYFDLFVVGTDGTAYHKTRTTSGYVPSLTEWTRLGGHTTKAIAATSRAPGLLDVFIVDPRPGSPGIYTKAWNGSTWLPSATGWWYLGGDIVSEPTVVSWGANRLDVFGRSSNGQVMHLAWNGSSWGSWESLGGNITDDVAAVSRASGRIDIFVRDAATGALLTKYWNGSAWYPSKTGFTSLGGEINGSPVAVAPSSTRMDVFVRGTDDSVQVKTWHGGFIWYWSDYTHLGGKTTARIAAVSRAPGLYDIFIRAWGGIYTKAWNGSSWWPSQSGWHALEGDALEVAVTSSASNRLEVLARTSDNSIRYRWWDGTKWWF